MTAIKKKKYNLIKVHVSEQLYLFLIALVFFSIAVFFGFQIWVAKTLPIGYISIFSSSLFLVFTILFLSWLLKVREGREWRIVKDEVHIMISIELLYAFNEILPLIKGGESLKYSLFTERDVEKSKTLTREELMSIAEGKIEIDPTKIKEFLKKNKLKRIAERLSNIELKYLKQLPAEVVLSLVQLQHDMDTLSNWGIMQQELDGFMIEAKAANSKLGEAVLKSFEDQFLNVEHVSLVVRHISFNLIKLNLKGYSYNYPNMFT